MHSTRNFLYYYFILLLLLFFPIAVNTKVPWSKEELTALKTYFQINIKDNILPKQQECAAAQEKFSVLSGRNFNQIRAKVRYIYSKKGEIDE